MPETVQVKLKQGYVDEFGAIWLKDSVIRLSTQEAQKLITEGKAERMNQFEAKPDASKSSLPAKNKETDK
jgi:hypothetical protein